MKIIPNELHGSRADFAIAQLFPTYSRSQLSTRLKQEHILINQKPLRPKDKVYAGDLVTIHLDLAQLEPKRLDDQPEAIALDCIYEDEAIVVINKPAGLVVHPGAGNPEHTLVNALLHHYPASAKLPRAGIIHRLDKDTTGLLIIAKTLEAHTDLVRKMQARAIRRRYLALVQGHLISGGQITTCYGRHPKNRLKMAVTKQGREAITLYSLKKQYQSFTLVDLELLTGRTHQIRVHMAHIKHPLVGDPLYGGRIRFPAQTSPALRALLENFKRQALHALTLSFEHPISGKHLTFEAPLPDDFADLIKGLDRE